MASEPDETDETGPVAAGGWCAPAETIYDFANPKGEGPIVPDILMKDPVERPPHDCALPEAETYTGDDWPCPGCGRWWAPEADYCYECGRSGEPEWHRTSAPLCGPAMADGTWWRRVPSFGPITFPEVSVARGGIRFEVLRFYSEETP